MHNSTSNVRTGLKFLEAMEACLDGAFVIGSDFAKDTFLEERNGIVTVHIGGFSSGSEYPLMVTQSIISQTYTAYRMMTEMPQALQDAWRS